MINRKKSEYKVDELEKHIWNEIIQGATNANLVDKIKNDYWNLGLKYCDGSAKNVVTRVRQQMKEDWKQELPTLREMQMQRLLSLYNESLEAADRGNALKTLQEINKVTGLYEAEKIDLNISGEVEINFDL